MTLDATLEKQLKGFERTPFKLSGNVLVPGHYAVQESKYDGLVVSDRESGNLVGKIDPFYMFTSERDIREYHDLEIKGFAVYDDGQLRFDIGDWQDPNTLVHVAVSYGLRQWIGGDWDDATEYGSQHKTVLIFNKTFDEHIEDDSLYETVVKLSTQAPQDYDVIRA